MNWLGEIIQKNIDFGDTVLDLGCGIMQATRNLRCKSVLGVDIFHKYLEEIKYLHPTIHLHLLETVAFLDDSFDVVLCTDVLEHLEKSLALRVLHECVRICRKKAIIYTPRVYSINFQPDGGAWGLGENAYQLHRCCLTKEEIEAAGFRTTVPLSPDPVKCTLGIYTTKGLGWIPI